MNEPHITCLTCEHWSLSGDWIGWCNYYNMVTSSSETCENHSPDEHESNNEP